MPLFEERISGGSPARILAVVGIARNDTINALDMFIDAGERAVPDRIVSDGGKEVLKLIPPRVSVRDEAQCLCSLAASNA